MQCEVEIDTQPCSAGKYGSYCLFHHPPWAVKLFLDRASEASSSGFRVPGQRETRSLNSKLVSVANRHRTSEMPTCQVRRFLGKHA